MSKHILLIRTREDNAWLAGELNARGIAATQTPLMAVTPLPCRLPTEVDAIIITSRHALTAALSLPKHLPLFCMGDVSAARAKAARFTTIHNAGGDINTLVALARGYLPAASHILYLRGEEVRHDLAELLPEIAMTQCVVYKVERLKPLLNLDNITGVALFSIQTAAHFAALAGDVEQLTAYCFSEGIAKSIENLGFKRIAICASQTQEAMLDCIMHDRA